MFLVEMEEDSEGRDIYEKARHGIKLKFDIHWVLDGNYFIKKGFVWLGDKRHVYKVEEYWSECEERKKMMCKYILDREPDELASPRRAEDD